jgi:hypothetical protein
MKQNDKSTLNLKNLIKEFTKENFFLIISLTALSTSFYIRSIIIPKLLVNTSNIYDKMFLILLFFISFQFINIFFDRKIREMQSKWDSFIINKFLLYKFDDKI